MSSSPTPTTFPLPSPTAGSSGSPASSQRGANYFFGFLITFVGLLIIFIVCGIGSRRRFAARREAALNGTFEPLRRSSNGKSGVAEAPQLYEHLFVIGEDRWSSLMPLSVRFLREEKEEGSNSLPNDLQTLPPATPAPTPPSTGHFFPSFFLPNRFSTHHKNPSLPTQTDPDPPENIEVAVMIVMPSRDLTPTAYNQIKGVKRLPEYQIGTINLPWRQHDSHLDS